MSFSPQRYGRPVSIFVSPASYEGWGFDMRSITTAGIASTAWGTVNSAMYLPIKLEGPATFLKAWIHNGATASGNVDVGLYREDFTKVVSTGAIAQGTVSVVQTLTLATTTVGPGRYYLGLCMTSATGTVQAHTASTAQAMQVKGAGYQTSVSALPSPMVPVLSTNLFLPIFGLAQRTLVT